MSARFLAGLLLLGSTCAGAIEIRQVQADRIRFDPAKDEQVTITFELDTAAAVTMHWYDGLDRAVRTLGPADLTAGVHKLAWDGRTDAGKPAAAEAYVFTLDATAADGTNVRHDLTDVTGSEPITATDVTWDADAKQIRYQLAEPARVNIRIGLKNNGPLLGTVLDWVPREAGAHNAAWDGQDASKVLDLHQHPELALLVDAYTLNTNTVLLGTPSDRVALPADAGGKGAARQRDKAPRKRMHYHAHQPLDQRGDVAISLVRADDKAGDTTVSGRVPLRLDVDAKDRQRILATRFEPVFFVDGTFVFENEVGFLPTTWIWDTTTVNNGWHYINVNVRGYEGNFGMATLKLKVENPPRGEAK